MNPIRATIAILIAMVAVGCAHRPEPIVRTVEVKVPVVTPCNPKVGPEPDWTAIDATLATGPADEMLKAAFAGYRLARSYIKEQAAGLKGCAG